MATSQITAAATSGRYMSDLVKSVRPALKLMNVLTTATDASEMPVAAGIPSSRTRPDVCRTNRRVGWAPALAASAGTDASLLVTGYLQPQHHQGKEHANRVSRMFYQPRRLLRLTSWSGQDKSLSIPTNIWSC